MKLLAGLLAIFLPSCCAGEAKTVLTVSSYRVSYEWSADVVRGIHESFRESEIEIATYDDFLDSRRDAAWEHNFAARYEAWYGKRRYDLAILIDDEAVSLVCSQAREMWRAPILAAGITEMPACAKASGLNMTAILEHFNSRGLIDIGLRGLPRTQSVVLITDETPLSEFLESEVRKALAERPEIRIEEWKSSEYSQAEVIARLGALPPDTLVYVVSFQRDKSGSFLPANATYRSFTAAADVPVIALSHHAFPGLLAGSPNSGIAYGHELGAVALRILAGAEARSIPVAMGNEVVPEVEEEALGKWGISESRLPRGVQVIRRHPSFYQQYEPWIIGGVVFALAQTLLIAALAVNIARRKKVEAQLVLRNEALVAAAEAKNRFVANISHELRTPLNGVMGMSDALLDAPMGLDERECVKTIRSSAGHLLHILNDILDITRLDSPGLELVVRPYSPRTLLQEAVTLFSGEAFPGVSISCHATPEVPERLLGDPVRVRQVLFNLTGNAVKFTQAGSIELRADVEGEWLRLDVIDTGTGIASDKIDVIFDRFVQGDDSNTRKQGGLGLGLAIAREIVAAMGGRIGVTSEPGSGSRFTVHLPVKLAPASVAPPAAVSGGFEGKRVLIAEDNKVNIAVAARLLQKCGCECETAMDGVAAVEAAKTKDFDLILMDLQMPEADGFAATKAIRESGVAIPIIAVTASAIDGERERCLAAGMNDYLAKPIDRKGLEDVLARWLVKG